MASRMMNPDLAPRMSGRPAAPKPKPSTKTKSAGTTVRTPSGAKRVSKAGSRTAAKPKTSAARTRRNPLPRVTRQAGQTVLVVPLPRIPVKQVRKTLRVIRRATFPRVRRLTLPRVGMRALAATAFFGALAYSLMPSALGVLRAVPGGVGDLFRAGVIAPTFSPEVQRWAGEIGGWAEQYGLDPNLMATVMQIESCGHPTVSSPAGAQGLFQVMPFHFADGEAMLEPNTNALRGAGVLKECLRYSNGDVRGALACYNGGPSLITRPTDQWPAETQRYVVWGEGIYADAKANAESATLDAWLRAGGASLCAAARNTVK